MIPSRAVKGGEKRKDKISNNLLGLSLNSRFSSRITFVIIFLSITWAALRVWEAVRLPILLFDSSLRGDAGPGLTPNQPLPPR